MKIESLMRSLTLTALDIGTNSIKGLCASRDLKAGGLKLLAKAQYPCFGVRNGEIVRPDKVAETIQIIKDDLSQQTNLKIKDVLVNIDGSHLFSVLSQGLVSVSRADQKISKEDVHRVLKAAEAIHLPSNKEVLDVFPKEFVIDGEKGIKNPVGLEGIRLEVKVLLICVFSPILENLEKAIEKAGLRILETVVSPLATARAVLTQEQKELGVILVDIGAGATSVSVFEKGDLVDFHIFSLGSSNITSDIALGLRTDIQAAEKIKIEFAALSQDRKKNNKEKIKIPEKSLEISRKFLRDIVESRVSEIFSESQKALKKIWGGDPLPSGIIFTGGGSKLPGLVEFAKQKFKLPCRLGVIQDIQDINNIEFSCCAGILLWGFDLDNEGEEDIDLKEGVFKKIKDVFKTFLP